MLLQRVLPVEAPPAVGGQVQCFFLFLFAQKWSLHSLGTIMGGGGFLTLKEGCMMASGHP